MTRQITINGKAYDEFFDGCHDDAVRYAIGDISTGWMTVVGTVKGDSMFNKLFQSHLDVWKDKPFIKQIIYNGVTTVCIFHDDTKVISRPQKGENYDKETGVAMCIAKYIYGSRSKFLKAVEKGHQQ